MITRKSAAEIATMRRAGRVVAAGALQDPPLDGPEDRRPALTA